MSWEPTLAPKPDSVRGPSDTAVVMAFLGCLAAARALTAQIPSMWVWGLNLQRFLEPPAAWILWAFPLIFFIPAVGTSGAQAMQHFGETLETRPATRWALAIAAAALVWALPDRTWLTGDFILREGSAESGALSAHFNQSLPLELLLNKVIPTYFTSSSEHDPNTGTRLMGVFAAAGLVVVIVALSKTWELSGIAKVVSICIALFGGYLTVFTGLGKPAAVLCILTASSALGCTLLVKGKTGAWILGISLGIALLTHRSALALIPVWVTSLALASRRRVLNKSRLTGAVLPVLLAGFIATPLVWRILITFDFPHHVAPTTHPGVWLVDTFGPLHLADLINLLLIYTPIFLPALLLIRGSTPTPTPATEQVLLITLVLSFLPILLFIHPIQGVFRDLEVFAPAGMALALLTANVFGNSFQSTRLHRWIAPALVASVLIPALQWLIHFHDPVNGLRRAHAFGTEAPQRPDDELAQLWDLLAYRAFRLRDWQTAVEASQLSVHYAPHKRGFLMLAVAHTYAGQHLAAQRIYLRLAELYPDAPEAWLGLLGESIRLRDHAQIRRAVARLRSYPPRSKEVLVLRQMRRNLPEIWPSRQEIHAAFDTTLAR